MIKLALNTLSLVIIMVGCVKNSNTKLVEKVEKKGDELVIPYEKYVLENGLTLVIHEDHSDPLIHIDVTYHVGSAREELKKSGFAHFFEHMMFQGSENVKDVEHFKIVTESGGTLNGSTNRDRTNYYQTVPSNQLETVLWLEADRMGFLLDAVTQERFEVQRATVKNEKAQRYDNVPYGRLSEIKNETLYPYGHPYSWLTIGEVEDLDRADVEDLKKFFIRWYSPNNATLTIGGDVNSKEVIKLVEKYFGTIHRGPEVEPLKLDPVTIESDRYVSYVDNNIRFPALSFNFPTVPYFHPDEPALDCLSDILGKGKSSYLYKKFILTQKAIQASASHPSSELAGEFYMFVLPFPSFSLDQFEQEMKQIIEDFAKNGVTDDDIQKFKAEKESEMVNGLASVKGKVTQLAYFQTFLNNPDAIKQDLERYMNVTKEDVMRVFDKYIKDHPSVIVSVIPNTKTDKVKEDNFSPQTKGESTYPTANYEGLVYNKPEDDTFDRSKRPPIGANPIVKVPNFWKFKTENGISIIGAKNNEIPTIALKLVIDGGQKLDAFTPDKAGLATLTGALLNESTKKYTAEEVQEELRKIGSSISINTDKTSTYMNIQTLKKNLDKTLILAEEILKRPAFNEDDFNRLKKRQLESIKAAKKRPSAIANMVFDRLLYGDGHVFSLPKLGDTNTISNISVDDVKSFYEKYFSPSVSELVIVGDIDKDDILEKITFLKNWESKEVVLPTIDKAKASETTKIYLVDKPEAPQSELRIGYVTELPFDATGEFFKANLMNFALGGSFNSRINLNLREDKGWTYGARMYLYNVDFELSVYEVSTGVKAEATDSSIFEIMKEIEDYKNKGITDEELTFMKKSISQRDARRYETPSQKSNFLYKILHYNLDKSFVDEQSAIIKNISKDEINQLAKKYLDNENMYILVVGDRAKNIDKLSNLGYKLVDLDVKNTLLKPH